MVPVRIENRAQLIYLLTEAAELEHEILCCYLFASFSMKEEASEGVTTEQLALINEWRELLRGIIVQEMIHFATACNLLGAIGGPARVQRPNLPTGSRAYPPKFQLQLIPFSFDAVKQFAQLEQPEAIWEASKQGEYRATATPLDRLGDIFSSERNFETVGELYRGIQDGFSYLSQKLGDDELFVGPRDAQAADQYFKMPGLIPVFDLESALAAIEVIVEQGEGASLDAEDSHYKRFVRIQEEYGAELARDSSFEPARPVLSNPYALLPTDIAPDADVSRIDDPLSMGVCNVFDGCYELMLQILGRLFAGGDEPPDVRAAYADVGVSLMFDAIDPLGRAITRLPAGPSHPDLNAGPSFRLSRSGGVPAHAASAHALFTERLHELQNYCRFVLLEPGAPAVLKDVTEALDRFIERLAEGDARPGVAD